VVMYLLRAMAIAVLLPAVLAYVLIYCSVMKFRNHSKLA